MHRLFGSSSNKPPPNLNEAISSTEDRMDSIQVKIRQLDAELARYRDQMKRTSGPGRKSIEQRALRTLKQKKMYESQVDQLQMQSFNMSQTSMTLDNVQHAMTTVKAIEHSSKTLRQQYGKLDIDKVDAMQDDMEDLLEQANEIQESLGRTYNLPDDVDEVDLDAELDALGDDLIEEQGTASYLNTGQQEALPDFADEEPVLAKPEETQQPMTN